MIPIFYSLGHIWDVTSDLLDDGGQKYADQFILFPLRPRQLAQATFFYTVRPSCRQTIIADDSCKHEENLPTANKLAKSQNLRQQAEEDTCGHHLHCDKITPVAGQKTATQLLALTWFNCNWRLR
jgi:hypothetical protein